MDRLYESFSKLLKDTSTDFVRYMYGEINWGSHMLGLVGPRGGRQDNDVFTIYQAKSEIA